LVLGFFLGGIKQLGLDADHSSPSGAMTKNEWRYTSIPATFLHGTDKNNFFLAFFWNVLPRSLLFHPEEADSKFL
jgi:hypothetical protein